jgi:glycosyltransferase involved in cell wall biosynthesis
LPRRSASWITGHILPIIGGYCAVRTRPHKGKTQIQKETCRPVKAIATLVNAARTRASGGTRTPATGLIRQPAPRTPPVKIAQIAPLTERVPPRLYGGTERIVSYLTEELVRQGHEVTLFASGDSVTAARLVAGAPTALRLNPDVRDPLPYHLLMLENVRQYADRFDVLHFHIDLMQFPLLRTIATPAVTTLHGRLDLPDLQPFYRIFPDIPLVSISEHQRLPMPPVRWVGTIHHGLPRSLYRFSPAPAADPYLAFLGRISPEKRPDRAIAIASRAGMRLRIAAKVDNVDREYWHSEIEPLIRGNPLVEFVGEIGERDKAAFLGGATALVFPIDWPEPFGLVLIEAMACGTPVIAFPCGSVPEVIDHGESGLLVESVGEAVAAVPIAAAMDRALVRATFERRFSIERVASDYLRVYLSLCGRGRPLRPPEALPLSA